MFRRKNKVPDFAGATLFGGDLAMGTSTKDESAEDEPSAAAAAGGHHLWPSPMEGQRVSTMAVAEAGSFGNRVGVVDGGIFGRDPETFPKSAFLKVENSLTVPRVLEYLVRWLKDNKAMDEVGIFRKSGTVARIRHAKELLDIGRDFERDNGEADSIRTVDVACVLKDFFKEMPVPILGARAAEFSAAMSIASGDKKEQLIEMRKAFLLLTKLQQDMVSFLSHFLRDVAECSEVNKMTAKNLAVCFEPNLFGVVADIQALSAAARIELGERRVKLIGATELLITNADYFR
mmetsp:Transcript_28225/g.74032  ORF Transcript_28225/g.74032 Transcript_28225/m.74032 type:complete len:290 (+) Transcript_28225:267-1136(+)|eukprot:CAMPEP_0206287226 /NCGR_PEP_ID=MMETSP0106_2-20121207/1000_1 /ASSEMBLY_ACC=CAM_ASM_000206 /TAXON_ID=81532 /ORGANISM="Acanthoeca-like sp., Strain 10tr" /LENGTH=289 /DNA_ID=CAMNT_0053717759 /DNA_START=149 /DNA_END=1018 /DNA_ORIENTATION=+